MFEIIKYPNKILRQKSNKVADVSNSKIQEFIHQLIKAMSEEDGIGLSAPQVGQNINIVAVRLEPGPQAFINPKILWKNYFKKNIVEEGCLSFPGIFGFVKRPRTIWLKYKSQDGKIKIKKYKGLASTILQHEVDHLRGVLFIDKIFKYTKGENKLKELKENNDD